MTSFRAATVTRTLTLIVVAGAILLLAGCGDYSGSGSSQPGSTNRPITREDPSGVVGGLVFTQPVSLEEARSLGTELGGDLIALYRTDYAFVRPDTVGAPDGKPEPSRFAYVDAGKIRERRLAAYSSGLAPPISGGFILESWWEHLEDQWAHAQEPGVRFAAMALYLRKPALAALRSDTRFRAVETIPYGRTDSLSSDYPGDLLLESEAFPAGVLTEPPPRAPRSSALTKEETDALVAALKAASPAISWAELMAGVKEVGTRKIVADLVAVDGGFILHVDGNPKHRMIADFSPQGTFKGEDPRYQDLPRRSLLDMRSGRIVLWGYPHWQPGTKNSGGETETIEGFRVLYMEYQ